MRIPFSIFLIFIHLQLFSQQWLGISSSNYSGTYGIYNNPANVADTRYKFFLNLAGGNIEVANNYASWGAPYSLIGILTNTVSDKYRSANGAILYKNSYTKEDLENKTSTAFMGADIRGPSIMYTFEKYKFSVGLTTRMRLLTNLSNTTTPIARILVNGTALPAIYGIAQNDNHFVMNMNGYVEMGLTFGMVIREQDENFLKAGLTVKRVNALMNVHYLGNDVDYMIDRVAARPKRQNVFFENAQGTYGLTKSGALESASFSPDWLFGNAGAGSGYGFDAGIVYEYRPDYKNYDIKLKDRWTTDGTQNKYLYKIGIALLDIGRMKYNNPNYVFQTDIAETGVLVAPGTFNKIDSPEKLYQQMNTAFGLQETNYHHDFISALPTAFSANFDYHYSQKFYLSASWIQSLRNPRVQGMNQPSLIAVTPRWEAKWLEVSLPLVLMNGYRNFTVGLAGRAGPLFIGTDNLGGLLNIGNPRGINAYFGLFLPILRKLPDSPNPCYTENKTGWGQGIRDIFQKRKKQRRWNRIR